MSGMRGGVGGSRAKVLLMGRSGSGKTSMRSVVFASYLARDTARLTPTLDVEHSNVRFLGGLVLSLWDCGGQHAFYDSYFAAQREHIFTGAAALIYVFDAVSDDAAADLRYYAGAVEALAQYSGGEARLMVLVHKMDLVAPSARAVVLAARTAAIAEASRGLPLAVFATSIFDESLYKAWSSIVHSLIPNVAALEAALAGLAAACDADEVVLFEKARDERACGDGSGHARARSPAFSHRPRRRRRPSPLSPQATFLVISHATRGAPHADAHRFEKVQTAVCDYLRSAAFVASPTLFLRPAARSRTSSRRSS